MLEGAVLAKASLAFRCGDLIDEQIEKDIEEFLRESKDDEASGMKDII